MEKDLARDYYMSSEKAVEYGLIDKILRPSSPEKPGQEQMVFISLLE